MSEVKITIREARLEDSSDIATVLHSLGWFEQIKNETLAQTRQHIVERIEQCQHEQVDTLLVAVRIDDVSKSRVVGYIAVHWFTSLIRGTEGYVSELFLLPSETGQGVGSRLIESVRIYAQERGCRRLLLMNCRARESYQRGFYTKHGWEETPDGAFFSLALPVLK